MQASAVEGISAVETTSGADVISDGQNRRNRDHLIADSSVDQSWSLSSWTSPDS
jgi:hypothetical protein